MIRELGFRKQYTTKEISILTVNYNDHDSERAKEGDIITVREPHYVIGTKEMTNFIWMRVEGLEYMEYEMLQDGVDASAGLRHDKRRYCVPLHRIKEIHPSFDIARARDKTDKYQPFMIVDEMTGRYLTPLKPFIANGLIFDKVIGDYL